MYILIYVIYQYNIPICTKVYLLFIDIESILRDIPPYTLFRPKLLSRKGISVPPLNQKALISFCLFYVCPSLPSTNLILGIRYTFQGQQPLVENPFSRPQSRGFSLLYASDFWPGASSSNSANYASNKNSSANVVSMCTWPLLQEDECWDTHTHR